MFDFTVKPDGGEEFDVTATSRDISHFERTVKGMTLQKLAENPRMSDLEHLAWMTASRRGMFNGDLEHFRATCDIDISDSDAADPT